MIAGLLRTIAISGSSMARRRALGSRKYFSFTLARAEKT